MRWTDMYIPIALASAALASTALVSPAQAQPGFVLDDFDSAINDEIGGDRAISLDVLANPFSQMTKFEVSPGFAFGDILGAMVFNSGLAAEQIGTLAWNNSGSGLSLDATELVGFELDFLQADQGFAVSIEMASFSTGGSASWTGNVGATSTGQTLAVAFGEFTPSGEFDLGDLDSVTMRFNVGESPRSSLDFVLTEFRTSNIPAPGSVAVVGLSGLLLSRRRRR
ncbi:MAG: hypothetical protein ACI89L_001299 [Phycisphaerales bacterium]|jgi:uncharacterized protein (TIGR03382 family)